MKKERDVKNQSGFEAFVEEYVTPRNVLLGVGVASLAGVATYSTVQALKNGKVMDRIKSGDINFNKIKDMVTSGLNNLGIGGSKKASEKQSRSQSRPAAKDNKGARKATGKNKAQKGS